MMGADPVVTVVVPTFGRVNLVRSLLKSVRNVSQADDVAVEILLVDTSIPAERTQLVQACEEFSAVLLAGSVSVSSKRNLGAEQARTKYVLFVDSDCVLASGCLAAHIEMLEGTGADASHGSVYFRGEESLEFRTVRASSIPVAFTPPSGQFVPWAPSANLMVRRDSFLDVRFDPAFGPPGLGGEDVDFGLRFSGKGFQIVGTPDAVVYHETETWNTFRSNLRRFFSWGRSDARLIKRHPSLSFLELPNPVLVMALLALPCIAAVPWSPEAPLALLAGLIVFLAIVAGAGAKQWPEDKMAGVLRYGVFMTLDLGRIVEACRTGHLWIVLRRFRYSSDQFSEEWRDIVVVSWANWLMALAVVLVLWWAFARS